jgi:hypothetical protein
VGHHQPVDDLLARARDAYADSAWTDAFEGFSGADHPLRPDDLEQLSIAAYMLGRDEDFIRALERAITSGSMRATRWRPGVTLSGSACTSSRRARSRAPRAGSVAPRG